MITALALVFLVLAVGFAALWWRSRGELRSAIAERGQAEAARGALADLIATVPVGGLRWGPGEDKATALGSLSDGPSGDDGSGDPYRKFLARLDPDDGARLDAAVTALREGGRAVALEAREPGGAAYQVTGRRSGSGQTVIWVADVSAVRRAAAEQAASEAAAGRLRRLFDALPVPVWRRDAGLALVDCNIAYAAALDAPRDAVLAEGRELVAESSRERALVLARAAMRGAAGTDRLHVVIGGSRRLLAVSEVPDGDGTIGFAVDQTDLEAAEGELARHINAHGVVLEHIHAAVAIYGADKRLKFHNFAFAELWGLEDDWLSGEPTLDELLERLRERRRVPELVDFRAFKRQQLTMFTSLIDLQQELMHLPDGRTLSVAVSPHPFGGLTFVYEDVTDRLALERSYNTLTEVQRETLDNLYEGIAVFGSDGRLKLHNPAYRRIWGLAEADLAGEPHIGEVVEKTRSFYLERGDWPGVKDAFIAKVTGQTQSADLLDRQDGSVLQLATLPLPDGNVLLTCMDVTDTARVERALRERNEALETAGRLKSEFIANVSYELRTPLNAIIGFAEILANQYFGGLNQRQLDYSRGILDSSHRLMSLINDILDLATIEAGYMTLETERIDIREMLQGVMTLTRERARNQGIELNLRCAATIGTIDADERRIKQALFNLISNAIKFTPPGGSIRITARRRNGDLELSVADTGIGIPSEDQERVFEKFERAAPQTPQSGAGLGLSLVKSLIELHGGTVTIESAPGAGTTVRCRLPAAGPPAGGREAVLAELRPAAPEPRPDQ